MEKLSIRDIWNEDFLIKDFLIVIFIILTTPWTWKILNGNIFLCLLLILITIILVKLLLINKFHAKLIFILCCAFVVVSAINLQLGFDQDLRKLNVNEEVQLNERHGYYARELRSFFLNRYSLNYYKNYSPFFYKFQRNFFSALDPDLYFFASHPRERAGINEFEKFPSLYFILFIIGVILSLQRRSLLVLSYLLVAASVSGLISPSFELGPTLFFSFITALVALGAICSVTFLMCLIKRIH